MDDIKAKQQVVEKIKAASKILVTVSNDPSLDALSAALGLALVVNKLDKHATAIFSGQAPQAMQFLEPDKTFEHTIDSLRDFIIALDKEKADHLRLKVEGDVAKIYITPYRTTITADDLSFSQGDYNVELVIALGVENQDHLDDALDAHGQILHDAPIVSITAGEQVSMLGGVDWHDPRASSLSEMVTTLAEALKDSDRLIDKQSATALLTGIVAATERFSNPKTTSVSMTIAAQLMADGADQQLIAAELEKSQEIVDNTPAEATSSAYGVTSNGDEVTASLRTGETLADLDARVRDTPPTESETSPVEENAAPLPEVSNAYGITDDVIAEETPVSTQIVTDHPSSAYLAEPETTPGDTVTDPEDVPSGTPEGPVAGSAYALTPEPIPSEPVDVPPAEPTATEVLDAVVTPPPAPATPAELGLPMPPPLPDFSASPAPSSAYATPTEPERLGDILAPEPSEAPQPGASPVSNPEPTAPAPNDPSQFKIPGQP